jgi:single-stranded-DNA-specific exonuclease
MKEDEQGLIHKALQFGTKIATSARKRENILLVCHYDADGICSASLLSQFVFKNMGHCEVRAISEPSSRSLEKISQGNFELILFLDLGSGASGEIAKRLGDKWLIIDHHSIPQEEADGDLSEKILNPFQFGFNGSKDLSCAGLIYFLTEKGRSDTSPFFAIVGALGDGQDVGPRKSLVGLNAKIVEEARSSAGKIDTKVDLLFHGRDVRPIHEALASTVSCFVPGLTGNKDACLASLRSAGIALKLNARWKTAGDLSEEEKNEVLSAIHPHLSGTTASVQDLVGTIYCLNSTDEYSPAHDARDFAALLSACGRMGKTGTALSLCLGTGHDATTDGERIFSEYRMELVRNVQALISSADRVIDRTHYSIILGDGLLGERMAGAVCQVLSTLNRSKNKIVFLRTTTQDGDVKISARLGSGAKEDLGLMMQSIAKATSGIGGGLSDKGGARFSIARQQEFQVAVESQLQIPGTQ